MIFSVICNDKNYLSQVIDWYNSNYKTDFEIIKIINDEVDFAEIEVTKYKPSDLFDLGYQFGVKEETLRQEGKIDW
jgi:Zn/Cd-binding protein ZinT